MLTHPFEERGSAVCFVVDEQREVRLARIARP